MASGQGQVFPDERGHFGDFGGKFIPETLMAAVAELEDAYRAVQANEDFQGRLTTLLDSYVGRPTPLYFAENLTRNLGGARIYLMRETWPIPAPTRSTTPSGRPCWPSTWANTASSPRPAQGSTALPLPLHALCSDSSASSTWARRISVANR